MAQFPVAADERQKVFGTRPLAIADGGAAVVDTRGLTQLTVIAGAAATVTVSRVDTHDAAAHTTGAENQFTVAADSRTTTVVDWPFYRVSSAGGACRVCCL